MFLKKEAPNFFIFLRLDNDNGDAGQNDSFKVRSQTDVAIQEQLDSVFLRKKKKRKGNESAFFCAANILGCQVKKEFSCFRFMAVKLCKLA